MSDVYRFYGFIEEPFNVTPDPRFIYWSPSHKEALASLLYGLKERRGFICMVAEVGTGKTTLINYLLSKLDEDTITSVVNTPKADFLEILKLMLTDFGISVAGLGRFELLESLKKFIIEQAEKQKNVVLIIDESQCLDDSVFEDLRLLSNFETAKHKLLQILLVGQPELISKLKQPHLRQLRHRLSVNCYINPLRPEEIKEYIDHRLIKAGYYSNKSGVFSRKALEKVGAYTKGIPRRINIVCHNAFLIGYALEKKQIGHKIIDEVIRDLEFEDVRIENEQGVKRFYAINPAVIIGAAGILILLLIYLSK